MTVADRERYLDAMGIPLWRLRNAELTVPDLQSHTTTDSDWQALQEEVKICRACNLHKGRCNTVFGTGSRHPCLFVIGEAPGANEDRQGKPFVGRAGLLLTQMLKAIKLKREQVFIGNILKCRPPNNRDPQPEEIAQCTPFLHQQLAMLKPKLLLAVGRVAAQHLLQCQDTLSRLRGRLHHYGDIPLIVTYHPAYLLRSPAQKASAYQDLLMVEDYLQKLS